MVKKKEKRKCSVMVDVRIVVINCKVFYDYVIEERLEVGMVLFGMEVKLFRDGRVQLKGVYVRIRDGEVFLIGCYIGVYLSVGPFLNYELERDRKLLLYKREIEKLAGRVVECGKTIILLRIYFARGIVKVELVVCSGKWKYDKW